MEEKVINPTPEQVTKVFNEVYFGWFKKYKTATTVEEFKECMANANLIDRKYPYPLCHHMLIDLLNIIEGYCNQRGSDNHGDKN